MDSATLLAALEFGRGKLLNTLDTIEKTAAEKGQDLSKVLAWRPGPGRAHIAWQALHCAATHDKYLHVALQGSKPKDEALVANYGGGSTPSDANIPTLSEIRQKLKTAYDTFTNYVRSLDSAALSRMVTAPNNTQRSVGESIILLTWHEAHHQGQIHLTWNQFKAAHGIS